MQPPEVLPIGAVLAERYEVQGILGRGGMGAVYRVHDKVLGESVALKTLLIRGAETEEARFQREVRLARRITHKNAARTYDIGSCHGTWFLTMELVEGQSVGQLVRARGRLSLGEVADIGAQICDGLHAAHVAGVIHRDLKPSNVIVEESGRAVILDFGIARAADDEKLTQGALGTPAYMAPEQLCEGALDERTDLYALGLVLHHMLAGRQPSWGGGRGDVLARLQGVPAELDLGGQPPRLVELVAKLLSPAPRDRPASAEVVAMLLRGFLSAEATHAEATVSFGVTPSAAPGNTGTAAPFAPLPDSGRVLAVLPFRERGEVVAGLGEEIGEELIDVLTRARGLRVLSNRATMKFDSSFDSGEVGRQLGADLIVDGSVQRRGDVLRVTVRLVDVATGVQLWSERFDGALVDVYAFQEEVGHRIAEALRVEIEIAESRGQASSEAIELYLAGRRAFRTMSGDALSTLTEAVKKAPGFGPALAARALAAAVRRFAGTVETQAQDNAVVEEALAAALDGAPGFAETQLAAGIAASQAGDYTSAAAHLRRALILAPTAASAQEYLGHLQCEAGRTEEGKRRLTAAMKLDPLLTVAPVDLARYFALRGLTEDHDRMLSLAQTRSVGRNVTITQLRIRVAAWRGDREELARQREVVARDPHAALRFLKTYCDCALSPDAYAATSHHLDEIMSQFQTQRFFTYAKQLAAEIAGLNQDKRGALRHLEDAAKSALVDLDWLEHCPALASVRELAEFDVVVATVRESARAIWTI